MSEHDEDEGHREPASGVVIGRSVKILGETVAPGASLVLDGKILPGAAHLIGGLVARWAFGPIGWLLVAANSYSKSVTGRSLPGHLESTRSEAAADSARSES
ncbi:MAG TPA: DUF6072 family protein [Thermoanaerobaculia bacterium]|jgi:hypothetical protein|nr:DUF6072 family protein [Thermoanaerobaculia bacterium]